MRGLLVFVLLAALIWGGWWVVGSTAQEKALNAWLEDRRNAGWVADVDDLKVTGFPNRFDTILTGIDFEAGDWGWSAPEFKLFALSYKPNHIIATWPAEQVVFLPDSVLDITSDLMRASLIFNAENALSLNELRVETANLGLKTPDWSARIGNADVAVDAYPDITNGYQLFIKATDLTVPDHWQTLAQIPAPVSEVRANAILTTDIPIDRHIAENGVPRVDSVTIREFAFEWAEISLTAEGQVDISASGILNGAVTFHTENWRAIFTLLKVTGIIRPADFAKWESGLLLASALEGGNSLTATFTIKNGMINLGPVPLGPAPIFLQDY